MPRRRTGPSRAVFLTAIATVAVAATAMRYWGPPVEETLAAREASFREVFAELEPPKFEGWKEIPVNSYSSAQFHRRFKPGNAFHLSLLGELSSERDIFIAVIQSRVVDDHKTHWVPFAAPAQGWTAGDQTQWQFNFEALQIVGSEHVFNLERDHQSYRSRCVLLDHNGNSGDPTDPDEHNWNTQPFTGVSLQISFVGEFTPEERDTLSQKIVDHFAPVFDTLLAPL